MLTDKVAQFHLLASGNPRPETTAISPLYQIRLRQTADIAELPHCSMARFERTTCRCAIAQLRNWK